MPRHSTSIDDDPPFQNRYWHWQRIGWLGFAAVVLAACFGLFGGGLWSDTTADGPDFTLEYSRFVRYGSSGSLILHLPSGGSVGTVTVALDGDYLQRVVVETVTPQPVRQRLDAGGTVFEIARKPGEDGSVVFTLRFSSAGWIPARLRLNGGPSVSFGQFVYP